MRYLIKSSKNIIYISVYFFKNRPLNVPRLTEACPLEPAHHDVPLKHKPSIYRACASDPKRSIYGNIAFSIVNFCKIDFSLDIHVKFRIVILSWGAPKHLFA